MSYLIVMIFEWRVIVALLIVIILQIINFQATNNMARAFKSKEHKNNILLINRIGGLTAILLMLSRLAELLEVMN